MVTALRVEIFPTDLDATVDFYARVLGFDLVTDHRATRACLAMERGDVRIGAAARPAPLESEARRRPWVSRAGS